MSKSKETDTNISAAPLNEPDSEQEITKTWKGDLEKPLVSIVCHTYQHVNYIKDAISGFLAQKTNFSFEIIIRDDASNDGTATIVSEYAEKYPAIVKPVLETENKYSKGITPDSVTFPMAKGKYIAFCEGDDYWCDPRKLQIQIDYLEKNEDCVITYHDAMSVDDEHNVIEPTLLKGKYEDYSQYKLQRGALLHNLTRCFRNVVTQFPLEYKYSPAGDVFYATLLGKYGKAKCLPEIKPAAYRRHEGGIWAGVANDKRRIDMAVSFYWIAIYHKRIGLKRISHANALSAILIIARHLQISIVNTLKFAFYLVLKK